MFFRYRGDFLAKSGKKKVAKREPAGKKKISTLNLTASPRNQEPRLELYDIDTLGKFWYYYNILHVAQAWPKSKSPDPPTAETGSTK